MVALNMLSRKIERRFIATRLIGNSGFLFNDLLNEYLIDDVDGETYREVRAS